MDKALYRAYRPQTFDEVVGQEAVTTALQNQIMNGHIAHAYLFAGTRGTGKTSCAKIFARAVNCLHPVNGSPCNTCANCRAIIEETTMDVVEMDAASNRSIDDIRKLRETVMYPPATLKYKVYIIDEAHMITRDAFNALLKIMEEPPSHLIFVLATTEPEKVPQTILSRVQRFEFRRIGVAEIGARLEKVAAQEGRTLTPEAKETLALAADGALRDGLSLLDQVFATAGTTITPEEVDQALGIAGKMSLTALVDEILSDRMQEAYLFASNLLREGKEPAVLLKALAETFRTLLLLKGGGPSLVLPLAQEERAALEKMVAPISMGRLLDSCDILIDAEMLLRQTDAADMLLLTTVGRLVDYVSPRQMESRVRVLEEKLAAVERWEKPDIPPARTPVLSEQKMVPPVSTEYEKAPAADATVATPVSSSTPQVSATDLFSSDPMAWFDQNRGLWQRKVRDAKIAVPAMLGHYSDMTLQGEELYVTFPPGEFRQGFLKDKEEALSAVLSDMLGRPIRIHIGRAAPGGSVSQRPAPAPSVEDNTFLQNLKAVVPSEMIKREDENGKRI